MHVICTLLDLLHTRDKIDYKWRQAQFVKKNVKNWNFN